MVPIGEIKEHPRNPNRHPQSQIDLLVKLVTRTGWRHPIVVSRRSNCVVAGHGRLYAARTAGWTEAPVDYQDFASEAEELPNEPTTAWCVSRDPTAQYIHPNQKPVELAARAIRNSSGPGDLVGDCFAGSGSTLMACEELHRRARVVELCPLNAAAIIERWHGSTGQMPQLAA